MADEYPLTFEPILLPKPWGGRRLERFGKDLPPGVSIGESWEIADLASTSPQGAGGAPACSIVASGPMAGMSLRQLVGQWGPRLIGSAPVTEDGGFPLLVKFLDASEHLSVQVHPSAAYAAANPGCHLKTETWVVVDAEPGSVLFAGLRAGATRDDLREAIEQGRVPEVLASIPVLVGQCLTLPSGTLHALGAGVLVAEIQTPSDTTFRVYDWTREYARPPRPLHLTEAMECIDEMLAPVPTGRPRSGESSPPVQLAATRFYELWTYELGGGEQAELPWAGSRAVGLMCLDGGLEVRAGSGSVQLVRGGTALIPASVSAEAVVDAVESAWLLAFAVGPAGSRPPH